MRGRPSKYRIVRHNPKISLFSPRGRAGRPDETVLSVDCFEAIHLSDFMGYGQKRAAESMRVSQQTFSRILKKAHKIIAQAIVNGKIIKIQGGSYVLVSRQELRESSD